MKKVLLYAILILVIALVGCSAEWTYDDQGFRGNIEIKPEEAQEFNNQIIKFGKEHLDYKKIRNLVEKVSEVNTDEDSIGKVDIVYEGGLSGEDYLTSSHEYDVEYIYDEVTNLIKEIIIKNIDK